MDTETAQPSGMIIRVRTKCPVCERSDCRKDFDNPQTMRCCMDCGADFNARTKEILLDPRDL